MKLIGCLSTFNEGNLLRECVRSLLKAVDYAVLFEGPFGEATQPQLPLKLNYPDLLREVKDRRLIIKQSQWTNQAQKLTELTHFCVKTFQKTDEPVWGMHLDGDEILLFPELLRDIVERFTEAQPDERYMNIKLVEMDGTVGGTQTHLIRMDLIEGYFVSGSQILFKGDSFPVSLSNPPGDRFPIVGEPHILHRSVLRREGRDDPELRAHLSEEAKWFDLAAEKHGLAGVKPGD